MNLTQLSSLDTIFLQIETPNLPMHVTSICIYDPSTAKDQTVRFKDILKSYQAASEQTPMLRRRLLPVPGNLDFPYWIDDPEVDIEFHVRHIALPKPGDWRQFHIQAARLHSRALDRRRPLWEAYVIGGLDNLTGIPEGSFAVLLKLHHSAVDGDSMQRIMLAMHDLEPNPPESFDPVTTPMIKENRPGALPLILSSYGHAIMRPIKLGKVAAQAVKDVLRLRAERKNSEIVALPNATSQHFQGDISAHRTVTSAEFILDEFKELRRVVPGATVNDLALTIIAGALRSYLGSKGKPLDKPLIAQVPVNIRSDSQQNQTDNQVSDFNVSCSSDIADPLERLRTIHLATVAAKKELEVMGASTKKDALDALGPVASSAITSLLQKSFKIPMVAESKYSGPNFTFSNMPASPIPIYLKGAEYRWATALGNLLPNAGLFITANSTIGKFVFGITACRRMMPDPEFFKQCLVEAYEETKTVLSPKGKKQ